MHQGRKHRTVAEPTPSSESTPSPLVTALQREHPEWFSEVITAFGETTFVVPREHIVADLFVFEDLA